MKEPQFSKSPTGSVEACLSSVRNTLPAVNSLLSRFENTKLSDYVKHLGQHKPVAFQHKQDFISEFSRCTEESLGPEIAHTVFEELQEMPHVLTANHHGIDTFAQSTQTNLMFSLRKRIDGSPARTVPVLACGSVPLNNLTYPRGLIIYAAVETSGVGGIIKLPIFPDSYKRKLVSVAAPFTLEMLGRAQARVKKFIQHGKLAHSQQSALNMILNDFIDIGQNYPDYSSQATVVNQRFWHRLFRNGSCRSELVYIELEKIASRLLHKDLFDKSTICHQLMFDPQLRDRLISNLDGQRACWQYDNLLQSCSDTEAAVSSFFWGLDTKGRQFPLCVMPSNTGEEILAGIDSRGQNLNIPFTPDGISKGLNQGSLLPSIFTSYLVISIARGVSCIGGYYQADYLPVMQKAVENTLSSKSSDTGKAANNDKVDADLYLSGMQAVGLVTGNQIRPAGPLEIMASGGLDEEQYEQIGHVNVLQAHIASLYDTIMDTATGSIDYDRTDQEIARLVYDTVGSKIIKIHIK